MAIPCQRPTSLVFGGKENRELFITGASIEGAKGDLSASIIIEEAYARAGLEVLAGKTKVGDHDSY